MPHTTRSTVACEPAGCSPLHRGVFMVGHGSLTQRGRWMGAVLAAGEGAALSHRPAARLHELIAWSPGRPAVSVPVPSGGPDARASRCTGLQPIEPELVDGIPCTPVAQGRSSTWPRSAAAGRWRSSSRRRWSARSSISPRSDSVLDSDRAAARMCGCSARSSLTSSPARRRPAADWRRRCSRYAAEPGSLIPWSTITSPLLDGTLVEVDFHWPEPRVSSSKLIPTATTPPTPRDAAIVTRTARSSSLAGRPPLPRGGSRRASGPHVAELLTRLRTSSGS